MGLTDFPPVAGIGSGPLVRSLPATVRRDYGDRRWPAQEQSGRQKSRHPQRPSRLWGGKSLVAAAVPAECSSTVCRPLRLAKRELFTGSHERKRLDKRHVSHRIFSVRAGSGAAKVSSRRPFRPNAPRAFADPFASPNVNYSPKAASESDSTSNEMPALGAKRTSPLLPWITERHRQGLLCAVTLHHHWHGLARLVLAKSAVEIFQPGDGTFAEADNHVATLQATLGCR